MKLINSISKLTGRTGLVLKKHSPEILLAAGIGGTVASAVLACRATLKCEEVLTNARGKFANIKEARETVSVEDYSDQDYKKDLTVAYVQTAVDFIKLYGPAVSLGVASMVCIVGSHGIMRKRNVALIAAYKAVEEGFYAYRKRVAEEFGEEKDYIYKHGLKAEQVIETDVDEDGKPRKIKTTKLSAGDPNDTSVYARFFDSSCREWSTTPEYNLMFLQAQQNYFNNMLQARGHVFLNEVYDALGIDRSNAGAVVGWVVSTTGDNYIDFGIFDGDKPRTRAFVNGYEPHILLDFNVDGVIYDLI